MLGFVGAAYLAVEVGLDGTRLTIDEKQDFADATYYPAQAFWEDGVEPYDHLVFLDRYPGQNEFPLYAPHQLLVGAPLLGLDFDDASLAFSLLLLALTTYFGFLLIRLAGLQPTLALGAAVGGLLLLTRPVEFAFDLGQSTILPLVGFALLLLYGSASGRRATWLTHAGTLLVLTKPQFGLPLLLAAALPGSPIRAGTARLVAGTTLTALVNLALGARLIDLAGGIGNLIDHVTANMDYSASAPYSRPGNPLGVRADLLDSVGRITGTRPGLEVQLLLGVVGVAVMWRLMRPLNKIEVESVRRLVAVAMVVSIVLGAFFHPYYDIPLAFVVVPFVYRAWADLTGLDRRMWLLVGGWATAILLVVRGPLVAPAASLLDAGQQRVSLEVFRSGSALLIPLIGFATLVTWRSQRPDSSRILDS